MLLLSRIEEIVRQLQKTEVLEEQLNKVLGFLQKDLSALSSGIFLLSGGKYQLKIGRNISHTFTKNTIFQDDNTFIKELKANRFLSLKDSVSCRFEHECRHILVHILQVQKDIYGFIFTDKATDFFTEEEELVFVILAEITAMQLAINKLNLSLAEKRELDETTLIYRYRTFMEKGSYLFHLLYNTSIILSIALLKINKYNELVKVYGHQYTGEFIIDVLSVVQNNIKPIDILGKIFDDTYAIIFPNKRAKQVEKILESIHKLLLEKIDNKEKRLSWGIATMGKDSKSFEQMISDAEEAAFDASRIEENPIVIYE
ncbi:MAG: diguanylate cyclase [Candidatus Cloacimonetes bacterium]|nr:diguanylate cyclase [Candidatus Cloacimonadota bacterium]